MNNQDIIDLAKQAGFHVSFNRIESPYISGSAINYLLADFALLVADKVRLDCVSEIKQSGSFVFSDSCGDAKDAVEYCAEIIRSQMSIK